MAGHSQFKNIMFRKGKQDKERSKLFAKLSPRNHRGGQVGPARPGAQSAPAHRHHRRQGGIHAQGQYRARHRRRRPAATRENYDEVRYEGRGPGGVALIVEALTDNRNRTIADVRAAFSKYGGADGRERLGQLHVRPCRRRSPIRRTRAARTPCWKRRWTRAPTNASPTDDGHEFLTSMEDFAAVRDALEAKLGAPSSAAIVWRPQNSVAVPDEAGETLIKLIEVLDDHDDVQNVYGNYELSDALMAKLGG